ncbi:ABC transporter ATP-binding protein [Yimella sp. cx-573]|nr:ABC transporter ATP-binding protein [Yimella sp. cx-573]
MSERNSLAADLRLLISTFPSGTKARLGAYAALQFLASLLDLLGLAAILPVMQVLTGADLERGYLSQIYGFLGEPTRTSLVLFLCAFMVLAFAMKAAAALVISWWSSGLINRLQVGSAERLLGAYLEGDYLVQRKRDASEVVRTVGSSVIVAHYGVLGGVLGLLGHVLSVVLILGFLAFVAPVATAVAIVYFGAAVFVVQRVLGTRNRSAGVEAQKSSAAMNQVMLESIYAVREIRLHDAQIHFVEEFAARARRNGSSVRQANFYATAPKYVLEFVTISGIAILLAITATTSSGRAVMPTLTILVAAAVKLLPIMTAFTVTVGNVKYGREALAITVDALRKSEDQLRRRVLDGPRHKGTSHGDLRVERVSFRYPDGAHHVLKDVSFSVAKGRSLAVCGLSGSGKTTLIDVVLGLLPATDGKVTYDGVAVGGPGWSEVVAYVPQDVQLLASSIVANVAFGMSGEEADRQRVWAALDAAQLGDFVASLVDGIDTIVGGLGGLQLSGGQKQRLGIARALYKQPKLMVLDEATSALDNATENKVSKVLEQLRGEVTIILVAHRLSTVRGVDELLYLEDGIMTARGTFDEVRAQSSRFAQLVELGRLDGPVPMDPEAH